MTQAEIDRLNAENAQLRAQLADKRKAEIADYADGLISQGILCPRVAGQVIDLLNYAEAYDNGDVVSFNEGESLTTKLKAFLEAQPKIVEFSEVATPARAHNSEYDEEFVDYADNVPTETINLDKQIRAYMKAHGVDYTEAFSAITQGAN